jgi:hypothetical protein
MAGQQTSADWWSCTGSKPNYLALSSQVLGSRWVQITQNVSIMALLVITILKILFFFNFFSNYLPIQHIFRMFSIFF